MTLEERLKEGYQKIDYDMESLKDRKIDTLPNTYENFDIEKAVESFKTFISTDFAKRNL